MTGKQPEMHFPPPYLASLDRLSLALYNEAVEASECEVDVVDRDTEGGLTSTTKEVEKAQVRLIVDEQSKARPGTQEKRRKALIHFGSTDCGLGGTACEDTKREDRGRKGEELVHSRNLTARRPATLDAIYIGGEGSAKKVARRGKGNEQGLQTPP